MERRPMDIPWTFYYKEAMERRPMDLSPGHFPGPAYFQIFPSTCLAVLIKRRFAFMLTYSDLNYRSVSTLAPSITDANS
jgi:hypothetical protein